jgi:hypothetical protein
MFDSFERSNVRIGGTIMTGTRLSGGVVPMDSPGVYLNWGVIHISVANLVVIIAMLVVFALALFLPFPGGRR